MSGAAAMDMAGLVALGLLSLALLLSVVRIVIGPTLADRVLALDLMTMVGLALIGAFALHSGLMLYLDIALALGLVGFLATIALARYIMTRRPGGLP